MIGKVMPHDLDTEAVVLGALMIEKDAIKNVINIVNLKEMFYTEMNQKIYKAITDLYNNNEPIDMITVIGQLRKNKDYKFIGGAEKGSYYISQLTIRVNSSVNIKTHCQLLVEMYMKRRILKEVNFINTECYNNIGDVFTAKDRLQDLVLELTNLTNARGGYKMYLEIASKAIESLEALRKGEGKLKKLKTELHDLDTKLGGFGRAELSIIAARPGMGKTVLGIRIANNLTMNQGLKGIFFSLEMKDETLMLRVFSSEAKITSNNIREGNISDQEWDRLIKKSTQITLAKMAIHDQAGITVMEVRDQITEFIINEGGIDFIMIDYIQLMSGGKNHRGNREQEISGISRGLKEVAKDFDIPVIALCQLSRAVETRGGDKIPMLSDLRESGSIEQDADQVMFIYRPEYYKITEDEDGNSTLGLMEVHIAKNRHGSTDIARLNFIGEFTDVGNFGNGFDMQSGTVSYDEFDPLPPSSEFP